MRTGRVKVQGISGFRNKTHELNDIVNEEQFPRGRFDELLSGGYVELTETNDIPANPPDETEIEFISKPIIETPQGEKEAEEIKKEEGVKEDGEENRVVEVYPAVGDTTRNEIIEDLKKLGVTFSKNLSKEELYNLWRETKGKK